MNSILIQFPGAEQHLEEIATACNGKLEPKVLPLRPSAEEFAMAAADAEAAFGFLHPGWLADTPIRWLHIPAAGANMYTETCLARGITLTNSSGILGSTIAEHALAMLFALARNLPSYIRNAETGLWQDAGSEWEIKGKTALVLGTGNLGNELAARLKALGMKVIGVCRANDTPRPPYDCIIRFTELDSFLPSADAVFGCLPATPLTKNLLNADRLRAIKADTILINVGRGDLVDFAALTELALQGHFRGIGLDVTVPEPLPSNHPLWKQSNVIITPHVAGVCIGHLGRTQEAVWQLFLENLRRYCTDEPLKNLVDLKAGY